MSAAALLAARLVIAAVLAVAGVAKLVDRPGTRKAVVDFGAPAGLAGTLALALPLAELATAVLLLPATTAWAGAVAALALFLIFTAAVTLALARGEAPDCNCFGQIGARPVGRRTLVRNGVLIALSAWVVAGEWSGTRRSAVAWMLNLDTPGAIALGLGVVLAAALAAGGAIVLHVLRSHGTLLLRIESLEVTLAEAGFVSGPSHDHDRDNTGLPPGVPAPALELQPLEGEPVALQTLLAPGVPTVLLFTSPRCGPCQELLPDIRRWQEEHSGTVTIALASDGEAAEVSKEVTRLGLENVFLDEELRAYAAFKAAGTPSAVLLAADGTVASYVASGADSITHLIADTVDAPPSPSEAGEIQVGTAAPDLELEDIDGRRVSLSDLRGREAVLVFWNPGCGFCREMHDDLLSWENGPNAGDPRLVVVSSGERDAIVAEGFKSRVLIDTGAASNAFGAGGTPMAVRLGADGRVRSRVLAGAVGVMALLDS